MSEGNALEAAIREIVRQELQVARTELADTITGDRAGAQRSVWMTPPQAALEVGIPVKAVRAMIKERLVEVRLRNVSSHPTQAKYLVRPDEVAAVAQTRRAASVGEPRNIQDEARQILSERDSRR